jgi:iron complex transport system ATP-binding protein
MVELRGVSYAVGGMPILRDVSLAFEPGRFNVVLGPNGAGKSTLLKLATGLLKPSSGSVAYGGVDVADFTTLGLARRRAVLSQHVELAFALSVRDVVAMGRFPHFARAPTAHDRDVVQHALEMVGMAPLHARAYPTLSGGERQKVQMARVLAQIWPEDGGDGTAAGEGRCLFLDEPTTSLDVHFQIHILDLARGLLSRGCTVVAVLHDLNVAFQYGDRFFVLEDGRLAHVAASADDVPRELIERVFRVRAHRVRDPEDGGSFWRFAL